MTEAQDGLLRPPSKDPSKEVPPPPLTRHASTYHPLHRFLLAKAEGYQQQYGDLYFMRLAKLKPAVELVGEEAWTDTHIAGDAVTHVDRVLDVRQGSLCWIVGTIYMDMPLKPNILEDISKDHWIAAPPPRSKYTDPDGNDKIMLEDESGRLRLIGPALQGQSLVTGCIVAVMGTENADGDFEVLDLKVPDLPQIPERWALEATTGQDESANRPTGGKLALVSGLSLSGDSGDTLSVDLLMEFLLGESLSHELQTSAAEIVRLVVLGNSLAEANPVTASTEHDAPPGKKSAKKYGYDASAYNPAPTAQLDAFLSSLLPSMPVTILPGASDPANVSLPQQALHTALFPASRAYADPPILPSTVATGKKQKEPPPPQYPFHCATNPTYASISGQLCLFTAGQPTSDIAKYLPLDDAGPEPTTLDLAAATLRWRVIAPTAPDTLWCYPYQDRDPFVIDDGLCPRLYAVGNADRFGTARVTGAAGEVRVVAVPSFRETGEVVLVDLESMVVEIVRIGIWDEHKT